MNKGILEQYDDIKKEAVDTQKRIKKIEEELRKFDNKYCVADSVKGGAGGIQHFTIKGFPYPEYARKKTLLQRRKLRLEKLNERLDIILDEVEEYIDTVEESRKRLILKYRYIDRLPWKDIAAKMGPGNSEDGIRKEIQRFIDNSWNK